MEGSAKLSVVVITFNQKDYITRTLDGIFAQQADFAIEVLVGDDCSTDGTAELLFEYAKTHEMKLFLHRENLGASRNLCELLVKAKGEYIAVCEGDDYWSDPAKLQTQIDFLETEREFSGCCHKFNVVDEAGRSVRKNISWVKHRRVFSLKDFQGIYLPSQISTFVIRNIFVGRSLMHVYQIDSMISDRTLTLCLLAEGDFYCFQQCMGCYRVNTGKSATDVRYKGNKYGLEDEYGLTRRLMDFTERASIEVDFSSHICDLYITALVKSLISKDRRHIEIMRKIRDETTFSRRSVVRAFFRTAIRRIRAK